MVVKAVIGLLLLLVLVLAATYAAFRYWTLRAEQRHEKEMLREKRDAEMLTEHGWDSIDRELEREKEQ